MKKNIFIIVLIFIFPFLTGCNTDDSAYNYPDELVGTWIGVKNDVKESLTLVATQNEVEVFFKGDTGTAQYEGRLFKGTIDYEKNQITVTESHSVSLISGKLFLATMEYDLDDFDLLFEVGDVINYSISTDKKIVSLYVDLEIIEFSLEN